MTLPWIKKLLLGDSVLTRTAVRAMARPGPIAMLMLVRDEADIIAQNIDFHRKFGIAHFVITDNGSTDGTREILAEIQRCVGQASLSIIDAAGEPYQQARLVNRMIGVAKQKFKPRWIISTDADEFWYPVDGRYDTEFDGKKNILKCHWHNFIPRADTPWQDFTTVGEMLGYHGRMSKLLCLARGLHGMYTGNHHSRSVPSLAARSENIRVYHYPVRTYKQFERKVVQGYRAAVQADFLPSAAWHWGEYYKAWEGGQLPDLYDKLALQLGTVEDRTMAELFQDELCNV